MARTKLPRCPHASSSGLGHRHVRELQPATTCRRPIRRGFDALALHGRWSVLALLLALVALPVSEAWAQVCARVKIEIVQEVTLERQAFDATMRITNGLTHLAIEDVGVEVEFQDAAGTPVIGSSDPNAVGASFFVKLGQMSGIDAVDGSGRIDPEAVAEIHWLIIPAPGAAGPAEDGTLYLVGATLSYTIGGEAQTVEVAPDAITVRPMPELHLDYFLPSQVHGDNPYTEEQEEPVPFSLGVRVANKGHGPAKNLKIESSQPKIVENELGLAIAFEIVGSEVQGEQASTSLLADFGTIEAGAAKVARWFMIATMQGAFIEFTATFTHADALGGALTSLLESVTTHTLVRDVLVDLPGRDAHVDFLAQDPTGLFVYESQLTDTAVTDVSAATSLTADTELVYTLTVPATAGFSYARVADPWGGQRTLASMVRADGKVLSDANAWLAREWVKAAQSHTFWLAVFDANNTAGHPYTVTFGGAATQNHAPVVAPLPDRKVRVGEVLDFVVLATDPDGTTPTMTGKPLPAGAMFVDEGGGQGRLTWAPTIGQIGSYLVHFEAYDGALFGHRAATVIVVPADAPNAAPLGAWAAIVTQIDTPSSPVVPTVVDADAGDAHFIEVLTPGAHGTATVVDGALVFVPEPGFTGTDAFTFRATDLFGEAVEGTASVLVTGKDELTAQSIAVELDGAAGTATVQVSNAGAATVVPVAIEVRAATCGGEAVVGALAQVLEPGSTTLDIPVDLQGYADGPVVLTAVVDAAGTLPEPNELDNAVSRTVTLGAAGPLPVTLGSSAATTRIACSNRAFTASGRSAYGLRAADGACHHVPVAGGSVEVALMELATGDTVRTASVRTDANGAWHAEFGLPAGALTAYELRATVGDPTVDGHLEWLLTAVPCDDAVPPPMVPAPPFLGPGGGPPIVAFDGGATLPWLVHPGTPVPTAGADGSGTAGATAGTGSSDQLVLGGPLLGETSGYADPFDADVPLSGLTMTPAVAQLGQPLTFRGVVEVNDSMYGLPVSWRVTGPDGSVEIARPTWMYANGPLHVAATFTPTVPGAYAVELSVGPGFADALPDNDAATLTFEVEQDAPAFEGLSLWLDARSGLVLSGGAVAQWSDLSGGGAHATQADLARRPALVEGPAGPALAFDGVDDRLEIPSGFKDFSAGATVVAVAWPRLEGADGRLLELGTGAATDRVALGRAGRAGLRYEAGKRWVASTRGLRAAEPSILVAVHRPGDAAELRAGGLLAGEGGLRLPKVVVRDANTIGGAGFSGQVSALLVYDRALTDTQVDAVERHLASAYGLYHPDAGWIAGSGYSGEVVAVVHASRWSKARADAYVAWVAAHPGVSVPAVGLALWLRADEGVTTDTSGRVVEWTDASPSPWPVDAVQPDATGRPALVADALDGAAAVRFDGTDALPLVGALAMDGDALTAFVVVRPLGASRWASVVELMGAGGADHLAIGRHGAGASMRYAVDDAGLSGDGGLATPAAQLLTVAHATTGTATLYRHGVATAVGAVPLPQPALRTGALGLSTASGGQPLVADVAEILLYDRELTGDERQTVEAWLADRYGLWHPNATWFQQLAATSPELAAAAEAWRWTQQEATAQAAFAAAHPDEAVSGVGLLLWLAADHGVTLADGRVESWQDRSPAGGAATQPDPALRPLFAEGGFFGAPSLDLDGEQALTLPARFGDVSRGLTIVAVARPTGAGGGSFVSLERAGGGGALRFGPGAGPAPLRYEVTGGTAKAQSALEAGRPMVVAVTHGPDGMATLRSEGNVVATAALSPPVSVLRDGSTAGAGFTGGLAEVLVWQRTLDGAELLAVEAALADRFGLYHPAAAWLDALAPATLTLAHEERWTQIEAQLHDAFIAEHADVVPAVGLALWLRADRGLTVDPDGLASSWADQSPALQAKDAVALSPAARPAPVLGAAGEALSFDGGDALALPPGFDDLRDGVTLVVVARPTAAGRWAPLLELADADGGRRIALQRKGTSDDARLTCGGASLVVPDALPVGEAAILTAVVGPDGQAQVRRGGIEVAAGVLAVPERALRTTNIVGGSLLDGTPGFEGELSELLLYDRELGQPELAALEADLADRHGLYHLDAAWIDGSGYSAGLVALIHAEQLTKAEADAWGTP